VNPTLFRAGQDTRPIVPRQSISSLTSTQLAQLRNAFAKLRALPSTDDRTWVLQADMHAIYCHACNNDTVHSVHGSWAFFPWHRAFLYYFERILGSLVGNLNGFRLPYWDWENHRSMPSFYRLPAGSSNSLYDVNRYAPINAGGNLPSTDGTATRIALLDGMTAFTDFGGTATLPGHCESNPHDPIHDDIGLHVSPWHDMGHLGFAARDPIFFAHHCNLDKIWSHWNSLATSSSSAHHNPTDPGFLSQRWNFYDENKRVVSMSANDVLNHQNNLRYSYPAPTTTTATTTATSAETSSVSSEPSLRTAPAVSTYPAKLDYSGFGVGSGPALEVSYTVKMTALEAVRQESLVAIILRGVPIPENATGVFDVMSVRGSSIKHLGTLAVVADGMRMGTRPKAALLDATQAVDDLFDTSHPARLTVVPREGNNSFTLQAEDVELRVLSRP
jgi:polyphenol oxidase